MSASFDNNLQCFFVAHWMKSERLPWLLRAPWSGPWPWSVSSSQFLLFCTLLFSHVPPSLPRMIPLLHPSGLWSCCPLLPGPHSLLAGLFSSLGPHLPWPLYPKHRPSLSTSHMCHSSAWHLAQAYGRRLFIPGVLICFRLQPMPGSQQEISKCSRDHWQGGKEDWLSGMDLLSSSRTQGVTWGMASCSQICSSCDTARHCVLSCSFLQTYLKHRNH